MKEDQKCNKKYFWGVFLAWPPFCRKCPFYTLKTNYNIYQVRMEFRKVFDILVHPTGH